MLVSSSLEFKSQPLESGNSFILSDPSSKNKSELDVFGVSVAPENKYSVPEKMAASAVEKANKVLINSDRRLEYKVHEATKQVIVKVLNSDTGEVVREIPSEKILDMVASMCKTAGILVDERR